MLILTGVTYEIESEILYFVYVVDAIPFWFSVEKLLIKVTEIRNDLNKIIMKFLMNLLMS